PVGLPYVGWGEHGICRRVARHGDAVLGLGPHHPPHTHVRSSPRTHEAAAGPRNPSFRAPPATWPRSSLVPDGDKGSLRGCPCPDRDACGLSPPLMVIGGA